MLPVWTRDGAKNGDVLIKPALKLLYMLFGIFLLSEMQVSLTATDVRFITSCHVLSQGQQSLPPNHAVVGFLSGHCSSGGTSNVLFLFLLCLFISLHCEPAARFPRFLPHLGVQLPAGRGCAGCKFPQPCQPQTSLNQRQHWPAACSPHSSTEMSVLSGLEQSDS